MRFKDSPERSMFPPGAEDEVMHTRMRIGNTIVMASDGRCQGKPNFQGFSLWLTAADASEAERLFTARAVGGQVQMPLLKTFALWHGRRSLRRRMDDSRRPLN